MEVDPQAELTLEQDEQIHDPYQVGLYGPGGLIGIPGHSDVYTFTIANLGDNADTYGITTSSNLSWADLSLVPPTILLASGEVSVIEVSIAIPVEASVNEVDTIQIVATSTEKPVVGISVYVKSRVF